MDSAIEHSTPGTINTAVFEFPVRVYYQDTDAGGIVYHARYLDFMERGRTEWLRALGVDLARMAAHDGRMFVAKSVAVDYRKPARLDQLLTVRTSVRKLARTYIDLNQAVFHGSTELTQGEVRIVCVGTQSLKPCALPKPLVATLNQTGSSA